MLTVNTVILLAWSLFLNYGRTVSYRTGQAGSSKKLIFPNMPSIINAQGVSDKYLNVYLLGWLWGIFSTVPYVAYRNELNDAGAQGVRGFPAMGKFFMNLNKWKEGKGKGRLPGSALLVTAQSVTRLRWPAPLHLSLLPWCVVTLPPTTSRRNSMGGSPVMAGTRPISTKHGG